VWTPVGGYVRPVKVTLGVSDGTVTEVSGPDVTEGLVVVVGEERADAAAAQRGANPFAPQFGRPGGGGPGGGGGGGRGGR
jgi:HlyD family secretion protein